jgi:archaeosine-15-forming tRNA-guanine transglycosylase
MDDFNRILQGLDILKRYSPKGISTDTDLIEVDTTVVVSDDDELLLTGLMWVKDRARTWSYLID